MSKDTTASVSSLRKYLTTHLDKADAEIAATEKFTLQEIAELQQGQIRILRSTLEEVLNILDREPQG